MKSILSSAIKKATSFNKVEESLSSASNSENAPKENSTENDVVSNTYRIYKSYIKAKGYCIRDGQQSMIKFCEKHLSDKENNLPIIAEAGTGTGKTISYSIPSIVHGLEQKKKVVIATATVALQHQILTKDLPDIAENSSLKFKHVVAKGRSHFACIEKIKTPVNEKAEKISSLYSSGSWNGERDTLNVTMNKNDWSEVTADKYECKGKQCESYNECPYYKCRNEVMEADVIVANHAFLLSDLAMGGGIILPEPESTIYAIDEFHNFCESAKNYFAKTIHLGANFNELSILLKKLNMTLKTARSLEMDSDLKHVILKLKRYQELLAQQMEFQRCQDDRVIIFDGKVPELLAINSRAMYGACKGIQEALTVCGEAIKNHKDQYDKTLVEYKEATKEIFGKLNEIASNDFVLWACYSRSDKGTPLARWMDKTEHDVSIFVSPITANKALTKALWSKAYKVIGASATITVGGSFDNLLNEIGTDAHTIKVPSPFDYEKQATLEMPTLKGNPNSNEFEQEV
ncbi:hypothetical protein A3715_20985, partial [Oleiphilus sp. HI0009]